jgi:4-hydroxy-2-oxoheptanedioate aldolase
MIPNRLKSLWANGKPTINGWCSIANPFTAEIMAAQGFDRITIDLQDGAFEYSSLLPMIQTMRASGAVLMARVSWNEPGIVMKALDAGAYGIICPIARFVSHLHYMPLVQRSFGPKRVSFDDGTNYAGEANENMLALARIDTADLTLSLTQGDCRPVLTAKSPR